MHQRPLAKNSPKMHLLHLFPLRKRKRKRHLANAVLVSKPKLPPEDEIVRGVMLTRGGQVVHPSLAQQAKAA